ncbi:MAG: sugar ABC transporter substrate-binding protein [Oscillospiraceae bacterium]|jgi:ribose transport system substrate-binding protein|nr:sugar ABC transporter substrate-binding protein [Oscillospiraceae bacterium]
MKKQILAIICASVLTFSLTACGGQDGSSSAAPTGASSKTEAPSTAENESKSDSKKPKIGFVFNDVSGDTYMTTYYSTAQSYAESLGIELLALDSQNDMTKQANQVRDLITKKVDTLIIWPCNSEGGVASAKLAKEANIPVMTANTPIDKSGEEYLTCHVGPSNVREGEETTKQMIEDLGGKGKFLYIDGKPGYSTSTQRQEGVKNAIEGTDVELLESQTGQSSRDKSQQVMENFLIKYPEGSVDAVMCFDDNEAIGAINALKAAKRTDVKVYAVACGDYNTLSYIEDGTLAGTALQSPITDAKTTMDFALKVAKGEKIDTFENSIETPVATPSNLKSLNVEKW